VTPETQFLQVLKDTMLPGGIIRFLKIKKDSNDMFFTDESITDI
jgi:hypothetical protein